MSPAEPSSDNPSWERHWFFSAVCWCGAFVVSLGIAGGLTAWEGGFIGGRKIHLPGLLDFLRFVSAILVPVSTAKFLGALLGWIVALRRRKVKGPPQIPG